MTQLSPAIFLDRDGTLMEEVEYCRDPDLVELFPGARDCLLLLKQAGFRCVIVTNQSGIGRGWISLEEYHAVHARLMELLGPDTVDATYYCPDPPGVASVCRKPAPGMVLKAAAELNIDLEASWMIGDKKSDIDCGRKAGVRTILVSTGYGGQQGTTKADFIVQDLPEAVGVILQYRNIRCSETERDSGLVE